MSALRFIRNILHRVPYNLLGGFSTVPANSIHSSVVRVRSFKQWYKDFWSDPVPRPPWKHCAQIGDPVLRQVSEEIPVAHIKDPEVKMLIDQMVDTLRTYNLVGIAANQIGVPLRIIAIEYRKSYGEKVAPEIYRAKEMELFPLTVFINPTLKVTNYNKKTFVEGCASVCGYTAEVARYCEVLLSGYNENGEAIEVKLKGWNARIAQHEMDHINGTVFTDIMDRKTFNCSTWQAVNAYGGKLHIPFYPKK